MIARVTLPCAFVALLVLAGARPATAENFEILLQDLYANGQGHTVIRLWGSSYDMGKIDIKIMNTYSDWACVNGCRSHSCWGSFVREPVGLGLCQRLPLPLLLGQLRPGAGEDAFHPQGAA